MLADTQLSAGRLRRDISEGVLNGFRARPGTTIDPVIAGPDPQSIVTRENFSDLSRKCFAAPNKCCRRTGVSVEPGRTMTTGIGARV